MWDNLYKEEKLYIGVFGADKLLRKENKLHYYIPRNLVLQSVRNYL